MGLWPAIRNDVSVKNRLIKQVKMDLKNKSIDVNKMVVGGNASPYHVFGHYVFVFRETFNNQMDF